MEAGEDVCIDKEFSLHRGPTESLVGSECPGFQLMMIRADSRKAWVNRETPFPSSYPGKNNKSGASEGRRHGCQGRAQGRRRRATDQGQEEGLPHTTPGGRAPGPRGHPLFRGSGSQAAPQVEQAGPENKEPREAEEKRSVKEETEADLAR